MSENLILIKNLLEVTRSEKVSIVIVICSRLCRFQIIVIVIENLLRGCVIVIGGIDIIEPSLIDIIELIEPFLDSNFTLRDLL